MTNTNHAALTQSQFSDVQDKIDGLARAARRGTPEQKATFVVVETDWENAIALPQRTFDQRQVRDAAITAAATKHNLL